MIIPCLSSDHLGRLELQKTKDEECRDKHLDKQNFEALLTVPLHQQRVLKEKHKPKIIKLKGRIPTDTIRRCDGGDGGAISFLHRYQLSLEGAADLCSSEPLCLHIYPASYL